jgi:hypothetical protein
MNKDEEQPAKLHTEDFLKERENSYLNHEASNYLQKQGIPPSEQSISALKYLLREAGFSDGIELAKFDFKKPSGRIGAETNHRLNSRSRIVRVLLCPMLIIPIWLMGMISLPAFGNKAYSERMQIFFLGALASNALGLCYVVTRDLFPLGKDDKDESEQMDLLDKFKELIDR